jgi:hypothetical protein
VLVRAILGQDEGQEGQEGQEAQEAQEDEQLVGGTRVAKEKRVSPTLELKSGQWEMRNPTLRR